MNDFEMNLTYLTLYAIYRTIFILVKQTGMKASGHQKKQSSKSVAFFLEEHNGNFRVKAEWRFAHQVFLYCALLSGLLLTVYLICYNSGELRAYTVLLPDRLAVVFLIFVELTWFLSGEIGLVKPSAREVHAQSRITDSYEALYKEYLRLWPDHIVQTGILHHVSEGSEEPTVPPAVLEVVDGLLRGDHLLVRKGSFSSISKAIFPALYRLLLQNTKLILIVETKAELETAVNWFNKGIEEVGAPAFAWMVASLGQAVEGNKSTDLIVVQAHELLSEQLMDYIEAEYVKRQSEMLVMVVEGASMFSGYGNALKLFSHRLNGLAIASGMSIKPPQYVVFSDWAEDLENAMHKIFSAAPREITILQGKARTFYYAVMTQEKGMLQRRIMPRMVHRVLDPEAALLIPALKWKMDHVKLVHYDSMPGKDNVNELVGNISHAVAEYSLSNDVTDHLRKDIELHSRGWTVSESDHAVVICHDAMRNLILTLGRWMTAGNEQTLVIVVSPPYLLRDYLAANAAFFMHNSRKISSIVPKPALNRKTAFYYMMDQLSRTWVTAEELQEFLHTASIEDHSIWAGVHRYIKEQDSAGYRSEMLETRLVKRFVLNEAENAFKEMVLYRLSIDHSERYKQRSSRYFAVQLQSGQPISYILSDHLYQSYLPGQAATFGGSWYRIVGIDPLLQQVELAVETLTGQHLYKQSRIYAIRKDSMSYSNGSPVRRVIDRFEITLRNEFRSFDVFTNGYFDFVNGIDLHSDKVVYVPLSEEDQGYHRSYMQGNLLVVTINSLDGQFEHADRLAFTLSYLMNELFVSLYPHNHAQLAACTALSDHFLEGLDGIGNRLYKYVPQLRVNTSNRNTSETLQLYVFEDNAQSLGLLESIVQHWEYVLEILDDYLFWVLEENKASAGKDRYICHGSTQPHPLFSFNELAAIIRRWLPESSLRALRTQQMEKTPFHGFRGKNEKSAVQSTRPFKSRSIRTEKVQALTEMPGKFIDEVVATKDDLQEIYREVRTVMLVRLKLAAREDLKISFVSAQALDNLSGVPVVPMPEKPVRICGQTIRGDQGFMHLYIANATTRVDAIATLAHELTHIWQYDHLQLEIIPPEKLEGHAMWVEINILECLGYTEEADRLREGLWDRSDVYGKGFRLLITKLEENTAFSNPFVFMLSMYGRVAV